MDFTCTTIDGPDPRLPAHQAAEVLAVPLIQKELIVPLEEKGLLPGLRVVGLARPLEHQEVQLFELRQLAPLRWREWKGSKCAISMSFHAATLPQPLNRVNSYRTVVL